MPEAHLPGPHTGMRTIVALSPWSWRFPASKCARRPPSLSLVPLCVATLHHRNLPSLAYSGSITGAHRYAPPSIGSPYAETLLHCCVFCVKRACRRGKKKERATAAKPKTKKRSGIKSAPTAGSSTYCSLLTHKPVISQPPLRCQCFPLPSSRSTPWCIGRVLLRHTLPHLGWISSLPLPVCCALRSYTPLRLASSWVYRESLVYTLTCAVLALLANAFPSRHLCLQPWEYFPWDILPSHSGHSKAGFPL